MGAPGGSALAEGLLGEGGAGGGGAAAAAPGGGRPEERCRGQPRGAARLLWSFSLFAAFAGIGADLAMLGPTLLDLKEQLGVSEGAASVLFPCRALGYMAGAQLGGKLGRARNIALALLVPLSLTCMGAAAVAFVRDLALACLLMSLQGVAMGILDTGGNVILLTIWRGHRYQNGFMHALHFFFGLGTVLSPLFLRCWLRQGHAAPLAWVAAGASLLPACLGLLAAAPARQPRLEEDPEGEGAVSSVVLGSGVFLFVYVGIEVAFGGYVDAFAQEWLGASKLDAAQLTSVYWGALCLGRLVAAAATSHVHHARYLAMHLVLGVASLAALTAATGTAGEPRVGSAGWQRGVAAPVFAFGFALAPLFPGVMLLTEQVLGRELGGRAASLLVILAAAGETACPLAVGQLFARSPRSFCPCQLVLALAAAAAFLWNGAGPLTRKEH